MTLDQETNPRLCLRSQMLGVFIVNQTFAASWLEKAIQNIH